MKIADRLWDLRANIQTIVTGESVGWKEDTLYRVPLVNGQPRPDLRNKRKGYIRSALSREAIRTGDTSVPTIEFKGLRVTRRSFRFL